MILWVFHAQRVFILHDIGMDTQYRLKALLLYIHG